MEGLWLARILLQWNVGANGPKGLTALARSVSLLRSFREGYLGEAYNVACSEPFGPKC
jgi:hypothetical protein